MSEFIYGQWRGKPAREVRATGVREAFCVSNEGTYEGYWQVLGMGYCTEFKPWPDQVEADQWTERHRS